MTPRIAPPPRRTASAILVGLSLAALGCSVKAPPRQVWTLNATPTTGVAPETVTDAAGRPRLGVTRFTSVAELRTTDLQYREVGGHLIHQTDDQWADYPDRMIEEMALAALARSGRFSKVGPAVPRQSVDAVLSTRVVEFSEWHAGASIEARVGLRWTLTGAGGEALASGEAAAAAPVAERTLESVVRAHADAARQAIDRLVADVAAAAAPARAGAGT